MIKVAIVGCGGIGRLHASVYKALPDVEIIYMVDKIEALAVAAAKEYGGQPLTDIEQMTERPDMVDVCTPPDLHTALNLTFIKRGIPVFSEKPLATDIEEAKMVAAAADEYDVPVGIGLKMRNEEIFLEARKHVHKLGKLYSISAVKNQPHHAVNNDHWTTRVGAMYELSVHEYDLINWIAGVTPRRVRAELCYDYGWEKENRAYLSVDYNDGIKGQLMTSYSADTSFSYSDLALTFIGEKGYMRVERPNRIFLHTDKDEIINVTPSAFDHSTFCELEQFVNAVREGRKPDPDVHVGANMTLMVEAARTSSKTGEYVDIERV